MATFVDKEYPLRSANAGFMPTSVPAVFWTLPTRIDRQIRNPSVAVLFLRGTDTGNAGECELR
jgi:hypothetical protein